MNSNLLAFFQTRTRLCLLPFIVGKVARAEWEAYWAECVNSRCEGALMCQNASRVLLQVICWWFQRLPEHFIQPDLHRAKEGAQNPDGCVHDGSARWQGGNVCMCAGKHGFSSCARFRSNAHNGSSAGKSLYRPCWCLENMLCFNCCK